MKVNLKNKPLTFTCFGAAGVTGCGGGGGSDGGSGGGCDDDSDRNG